MRQYVSATVCAVNQVSSYFIREDSFESVKGRKFRYNVDSDRVIAHIDVDCFSVQIARRHDPDLVGNPCATRRTNFKPLDSVSYEAREKGVVKGMTLSEAKSKCPDLIVVTKSRKMDRKVSEEMFDVIKKFSKDMIIEKTSSDDFFVDLTEKCDKYIADKFRYEQNFLDNIEVVVEGGNRRYKFVENRSLQHSKWAEAAVIVCDICDEVYSKTGLICSAGISFNKLLAKIGCKINKPHKITLINSKPGIYRVFKSYPICMVSGLGANFGSFVENKLKVSELLDLRNFRRKKLMDLFGRGDGSRLWQVSRGIDWTPVKFKLEFKPLFQEKMFNKAIECRAPALSQSLKTVCKQLTNKFIKDMNENKRIAHRIRIEVFSKYGRNFNTTAFLFSKKYDWQQIYTTVKDKGFPKVEDNVPKHIIGYRIIGLDFGSVQNTDFESIDNITQQMSELII